MSDKKIKCWSCKKSVSFKSIASNDGSCPKCNAEIDMYCLAEQLKKTNQALIAELMIEYRYHAGTDTVYRAARIAEAVASARQAMGD